MPKTRYDPEYVRDISERLYRKKLDAECGENTARMTDDDIANGVSAPCGRQGRNLGFFSEPAFDNL